MKYQNAWGSVLWILFAPKPPARAHKWQGPNDISEIKHVVDTQ